MALGCSRVQDSCVQHLCGIDNSPGHICDCEVIPLPISELADEAGNLRTLNMVALGAYLHYTNLLDYRMVIELLPEIISRKHLIPVNEKAIRKGVEAVKAFVPTASQASVVH